MKMMDSFFIRHVIPDDHPDLRRAIIELQDYEVRLHSTRLPGELIADAYLAWLLEQVAQGGAIFVAEHLGHFAGYAACWIEYNDVIAETPDSNRFGLIGDICVMPEYRGQRLATLLLTNTERHLMQGGVTRVRICSLAANQSARSAYENAGFVPYEIVYEKEI